VIEDLRLIPIKFGLGQGMLEYWNGGMMDKNKFEATSV